MSDGNAIVTSWPTSDTGRASANSAASISLSLRTMSITAGQHAATVCSSGSPVNAAAGGSGAVSGSNTGSAASDGTSGAGSAASDGASGAGAGAGTGTAAGVARTA